MKNTDLLPYWSNHTKELSKDLWIPSKNSLASIFPNKLHHHSWFNFVSFNNQNSLNKFNINLPVEQSNKPLLRAKKIRIYPNVQQKNLFRQWFGTSRKTYNDTVNHLNLPQEQREKHWMGAAKLILNSLPDWAKSILMCEPKCKINSFFLNLWLFRNSMKPIFLSCTIHH